MRAAVDRQDGASAQPAALRCRQAPHRRRLRCAATARGAGAAARAPGVAVPTGLFQRERHRSVRVHDLRCVSGSVRRGLVHRQGDLRRRCVRSLAVGQSSGKYRAQSRPVRRHLRTRRLRIGHRTRRGISVPLRRGRSATAPLGTRRLATAAVVTEARGCRDDGTKGGASSRPSVAGR